MTARGGAKEPRGGATEPRGGARQARGGVEVPPSGDPCAHCAVTCDFRTQYNWHAVFPFCSEACFEAWSAEA